MQGDAVGAYCGKEDVILDVTPRTLHTPFLTITALAQIVQRERWN